MPDTDAQLQTAHHPDDLSGLPSYLLTRISHRYTQAIRKELRGQNLNTSSARVIAALRVMPGLTVNELCSHTISEQPTMSHALDRLEKDGLIYRQVHEEDSRIRKVFLTELGCQQADVVWPIILRLNEKMMQNIPEQDRITTMRTLGAIFENLNQK